MSDRIAPLLEAAELLGIFADAGEVARRESIGGTIEGHEVVLGLQYRLSEAAGYVVLARAASRFAGQLSVRRLYVKGRKPGISVPSGDPAFDAAIEVRGEPAVARAWLSKRVRDRVEPLLDGAQELTLLMNRAALASSFARTPEVLAESVRSLVRLVADDWVDADSVCDRLFSNAAADPHPGVCGAAWDSLQAALLTADHQQRIRFYEAIIREDRAPAAHRSHAITRMITLDYQRAGMLVDALLSSKSAHTRSIALLHLEEVDLAPALPRLIALASGVDDNTATVIARALGQSRDVRAEPTLLRMLADRRTLETRIEAAAALAACGTPIAIGPLRAAAKGFFTDRRLVRAAEAAVEELLRRHPGLQGGLSISESAGGALSLEDGAEGALSVTGARGSERES